MLIYFIRAIIATTGLPFSQCQITLNASRVSQIRKNSGQSQPPDDCAPSERILETTVPSYSKTY